MNNIIAIYNATNLKSGSTTLAISLATGLSFWGNKKVLLINYSLDKRMEKYLNDLDFKYTLDYLNVFQGDEEHLFTSINQKMDVIGNFEIAENLENKNMSNKVICLLIKIKHLYDFIVIDTTIDRLDLLKKINPLCLPVIEIDQDCIESFVKLKSIGDNSLCIVNKIHTGLRNDKYMEKILVKYNIKNYMPIIADANVMYQTNFGSLYHYLIENINVDDMYIHDTLDICFEIMKKFDPLLDMNIGRPSLLKRLENLFPHKTELFKV